VLREGPDEAFLIRADIVHVHTVEAEGRVGLEPCRLTFRVCGDPHDARSAPRQCRARARSVQGTSRRALLRPARRSPGDTAGPERTRSQSSDLSLARPNPASSMRSHSGLDPRSTVQSGRSTSPRRSRSARRQRRIEAARWADVVRANNDNRRWSRRFSGFGFQRVGTLLWLGLGSEVGAVLPFGCGVDLHAPIAGLHELGGRLTVLVVRPGEQGLTDG
jgi:hypothetical protein